MITSKLLKEITNNEYYWLLLITTPNLSFNQIKKIINHFGTVENVYQQSEQILASIIHPIQAKLIYNHSSKQKVEEMIKWRDSHANNDIIYILNHNYPEELYQLPNPPKVLYIRGNKSLLNNKKVAILGTKNPSQDGKLNSIKFARELAHYEVTVVAGLYGEINKYIHSGVKDQQGSSIAVVAVGLDMLIKYDDVKLCEQILENNGLIVTEYNLGSSFILSNLMPYYRIITSLGTAVLIIESLLTGNIMSCAEFALDIGKEVMAVPGSINNSLSKGCHKLIKNGARLIDTTKDILEEINYTKNKITNNNAVRENVILSSMLNEPISINDLSKKTDLSLNDLFAEILKLELNEK